MRFSDSSSDWSRDVNDRIADVDASEYSRFIYMFTIGFEFFYMIIAHRLYRKYWLRRRSNHSFARKMMLITTSGEAEQVITNIIKEKT